MTAAQLTDVLEAGWNAVRGKSATDADGKAANLLAPALFAMLEAARAIAASGGDDGDAA
jgi:hypothetical protein